ncbi:hypothetical protein BaRGS_00021095 [Batillaria attramentaria]|uniref:Uncharacterized protein n=1 Tax=Batillaria attramentaria TaxID=370345 RepID=A0ABD0KKD4_9CAEN
MGASHQKLADSPRETHSQSSPVMETDYEATPPRGQGLPTRQLPFDPRSPTDNINRTPIIVDKTPDNCLDPRSPTPGVERTPLTLLTSRGIGPVSMTQEEAEVVETVTCETEQEMMTPQKEALSPDSGCSLQDMLVDVDDSSPLILSTEEENTNSTDSRPFARLVSRPKQLFPTTRQASLTKEFSTPRSPLTAVAVDANSPRQIVQAKQRKQVARHGSGFRGLRDPCIDKENVSH